MYVPLCIHIYIQWLNEHWKWRNVIGGSTKGYFFFIPVWENKEEMIDLLGFFSEDNHVKNHLESPPGKLSQNWPSFKYGNLQWSMTHTNEWHKCRKISAGFTHNLPQMLITAKITTALHHSWALNLACLYDKISVPKIIFLASMTRLHARLWVLFFPTHS